jgi:hypothetical protein
MQIATGAMRQVNRPAQPPDCLSQHRYDAFPITGCRCRCFRATTQSRTESGHRTRTGMRVPGSVLESIPIGPLGSGEIACVPCDIEALYEGIRERHSAARTPHRGWLRESSDTAQQLHRDVCVRTPFHRSAAGKSRTVLVRETVDGVPVCVVSTVWDRLDQADGLVEGSDVARLLTVDDQISRMVQRVAPRVVSGLIGEPRPQLARHSPVIDQVEQSEYADRCLKVSGSKVLGAKGAPVRQGPSPIERGNGVQHIGVGRFGSPVH